MSVLYEGSPQVSTGQQPTFYIQHLPVQTPRERFLSVAFRLSHTNLVQNMFFHPAPHHLISGQFRTYTSIYVRETPCTANTTPGLRLQSL